MDTFVIRFLIGGVVVSLFAALGDILRPKSFAGLFGAAPSIALATVGLTIFQDGKAYAALECRSMMLGAVAFFAYALLVGWVLRRYKPHALFASLALMPTWFAISFGLWFLFEGAAMRRIEVNLSSLRATKPHEYVARFLFGGFSTVAAGLIAKRFGPGIGGLFLAFPAIFPASASLIESHEIKRKASVVRTVATAGGWPRA